MINFFFINFYNELIKLVNYLIRITTNQQTRKKWKVKTHKNVQNEKKTWKKQKKEEKRKFWMLQYVNQCQW